LPHHTTTRSGPEEPAFQNADSGTFWFMRPLLRKSMLACPMIPAIVVDYRLPGGDVDCNRE
jgi:hypothetical protein